MLLSSVPARAATWPAPRACVAHPWCSSLMGSLVSGVPLLVYSDNIITASDHTGVGGGLSSIDMTVWG